VQDKKYISLGLDLEVGIKELADYDEQCRKLEADAKRYNHYEHTLNMTPSRLQELEDLRTDLTLRYSMWKSLKEWK
jgi:dynein heavy chain